MRWHFGHIQSVEDLACLSEDVLRGLVAELFRIMGYDVKLVLEAGEFGADFIVTKTGRKTTIRCRQLAGPAGIDVVQEAYFAKGYYRTDQAWAVCPLGFTSEAEAAAKRLGVHLRDGQSLLDLMKAYADAIARYEQPEEEPVGRPSTAVSDKSLFSLSEEVIDHGFDSMSNSRLITLVQYHGHEREVVIPSDMGIRFIGPHAFSDPTERYDLREGFTRPACGWQHIRSVVIPEGVEWIGPSAFEGCTGLESVSLPTTLDEIGLCVFEGCASLRSVELPSSLRKIGFSAYEGCTALRKLELPDSLCEIESSAFRGCTSLHEVELPDSLQTIGFSAFADCTSLTSIRIPQGVERIDDWVFRGCTSLREVELPDSLREIGASAFAGCTSLESMRLPAALQSVGASAFSGCDKLRFIELPASVNAIGPGAFEGCSSLWSIYMPAAVETIEADAFASCEFLSRVALPEGLKSIDKHAFKGCTWLEKVELPASIERVEPLAFEGCSRLKEVSVVGEGCQGTFHRSAFVGCPTLDEASPISNLPSTATLVNDTAFPGMFDGPSRGLGALMFNGRVGGDSSSAASGFLITSSGVEGLNSFSSSATEGMWARFWVRLNDGCERGYYAVKGAGEGGSRLLAEGHLEPKVDGDGSGDGGFNSGSRSSSNPDPSQNGSITLTCDALIYLCGCHLVPHPSIDAVQAARVVGDYRARVRTLVQEYRSVEADESGRGKRFEQNKLAKLDELYALIKHANEQFRLDAKPTGIDCAYYIRTSDATMGEGGAPSERAARKAAQAKAQKRLANSKALEGCLSLLLKGCAQGCFFLAIAFSVIIAFGLLLMLVLLA